MLPIALFFTAIAAVIDAREHRIPNWVSGGLLLAGTVLTFLGHHPLGGWAALYGFGAAVGLSVLGYAKGVLGAGDVKLMAAIGVTLGLLPFLVFLAASSLCGGLLAVRAWRSGKREIAYAPAMLLGLLALVPLAYFG